MHMAEFYPALQVYNESQGTGNEQPINEAAEERLQAKMAAITAREDPVRRKAALNALIAKAQRKGTPPRANAVRRTHRNNKS